MEEVYWETMGEGDRYREPGANAPSANSADRADAEKVPATCGLATKTNQPSLHCSQHSLRSVGLAQLAEDMTHVCLDGGLTYP